MANIELVIKIPEEMYKNIQNKSTEIQAEGYIVENAILNGTLLPKGHGRLIDADALPLHAIDDANYGSNYIHIAPTIIEADKESEDEIGCRLELTYDESWRLDRLLKQQIEDMYTYGKNISQKVNLDAYESIRRKIEDGAIVRED